MDFYNSLATHLCFDDEHYYIAEKSVEKSNVKLIKKYSQKTHKEVGRNIQHSWDTFDDTILGKMWSTINVQTGYLFILRLTKNDSDEGSTITILELYSHDMKEVSTKHIKLD